MSDDVSPGATVDLSPAEEDDVRQLAPPRAAVVFETVRREGEVELGRSVLSLAASGLAAGLSMGMSLAGEGLLQSMLGESVRRPLVSSLGYSVGFVIVILGRQQLFTENTVTAILPLLDSPHKRKNLLRVARLWVLVLFSNLVGAAIFAFAAAKTTVFAPAVKAAFLELGLHAAQPAFVELFSRGIFAGWLIALMVWLLPAANHMRFFVVVFVTYFVGVGSFSHIIAGSVEVLYAVADGHITIMQYFLQYFMPVFLGNSLGGVTLVSLLNYGQVIAEGE